MSSRIYTELVGIPLAEDIELMPLKVAGYADDTSIYIAHCNMQQAALNAVQRFSTVSGLKLNVKKSSAIFLCDCGSQEEQERQTQGGWRKVPRIWDK
jgi:hypothetical protein